VRSPTDSYAYGIPVKDQSYKRHVGAQTSTGSPDGRQQVPVAKRIGALGIANQTPPEHNSPETMTRERTK
jgi:hypothetical protein